MSILVMRLMTGQAECDIVKVNSEAAVARSVSSYRYDLCIILCNKNCNQDLLARG
jgi:hypothetical protein